MTPNVIDISHHNTVKNFAALKAARHDLWLFADGSQQDDEVIRGEVAMRAVDEALAKAGVA